ncbi:MAG: DUF2294 family protein [Thermoleophilia bacterium]|nr:DUF2294 family protein [Thermoleophilia bacterium]
MSALVRERWGRGPRRSRAYWAGPDMLLVTLDDAHTEAELTLIRAGHGEHVLTGRRLLGEHAEPDVRRIAETAIGRPVRTVLAQSSLEPPVTAFVFLFEPTPREAARDERLGDALREALEQTSATRALMAESEQAMRQSRRREQVRPPRKRQADV